MSSPGESSEDAFVQHVRWHLGFPVADAASSEAWVERFAPGDSFERMADAVSEQAADFFKAAVRLKLGLLKDHVARQDEVDELAALWASFVEWVRADEARRGARLDQWIKNGFRVAHKVAENSQPRAGPAEPAVPSDRPESVRGASPTARSAISIDKPDAAGSAAKPPAANPAGLWKYQPVPVGGPENHAESDARASDLPNGLNVVAARVRGKKHKHEGTNGDDWFEYRTAGAWTIVAVADGAGSARFSRIGARSACEAAVLALDDALTPIRLGDRVLTSDSVGRSAETFAYADAELQKVQEAVHDAFHKAYASVEAALDVRRDDASFVKDKGGPLDLKDFSATLLLAVHSPCNYEGRDLDLVIGCQVGDGMVAAVHESGTLHLLATPDSGQFSGETDFLTSKRKLEPASLASRTRAFLGSLRCLMVMSDGVADDYFPNDPGMLRLYADLALNRIVTLPPTPADKASDVLGGMKISDIAALTEARDASMIDGERVAAPDATESSAVFCSAAEFATETGVPAEQLPTRPGLLSLAAAVAGDDGRTPQARLRDWLDTYKVRGSFDDRTLVAVYPRAGG